MQHGVTLRLGRPLMRVLDMSSCVEVGLDCWLQEMMSKAQRLGPEIIAVLDGFLHTHSMAVD